MPKKITVPIYMRVSPAVKEVIQKASDDRGTSITWLALTGFSLAAPETKDTIMKDKLEETV